MKTTIRCRVPERGVHYFYLVHDGQEYYLFQQEYRKGVQKYYRKGVILDEAINFARTHRDCSMERTMIKIQKYTKYIEKEYDIQVFEQTKKKYKNRHENMARCA